MKTSMKNTKKKYTKPVLNIKGHVKNLTLANGSFSTDAPAGGTTDGPFGG